MRKFECRWGDKVNTAFFRGTATGGGVTVATNQRLHLALLSYLWTEEEVKAASISSTSTSVKRKRGDNSQEEEGNGVGDRPLKKSDPSEQADVQEEEDSGGGWKDITGTVQGGAVTESPTHGSGVTDRPHRLDAKITAWNLRDKKIAGSPMTFLNPKDFPFKVGEQNFTPIYKQSRYKYLVYVEGHCAACRYGFMMRLGSVILKVESRCVADQMWYFPLLRPYFDHVPVKADLSDLKEVIDWCRSHDQECRVIADNARRLYERFLSKEGVMDYLQVQVEERRGGGGEGV